MISMKEFAEFNAEATKSTTSTVENAIALKDFILFKVPALNVLLVNHMMSTLKPAQSFPAKVPMSFTALLPDNASANLNMLELKESAITVLLDITMTATLINASANPDSNLLVDSVNPSALLTKPTSMENVNATMDFLSATENALAQDHALLTAILMITVDAASAAQVSQSSMVNAPAINIVDRTDILDMVNAIARKDISGFLELADLVVPMKLSTVLFANALLDIPATSTDYVLNLTSTPTVMITKDTTVNSRLVFASKEPLSSEDNVKPSQAAQPTLTSMVSNAFATLDSSSVDHHASVLKLNSQLAQIMPISMVFHAHAMLVSSKAASQLAPLVKTVLNGTELTASPHQEKIAAPADINSTMFQTTANP